MNWAYIFNMNILIGIIAASIIKFPGEDRTLAVVGISVARYPIGHKLTCHMLLTKAFNHQPNRAFDINRKTDVEVNALQLTEIQIHAKYEYRKNLLRTICDAPYQLPRGTCLYVY